MIKYQLHSDFLIFSKGKGHRVSILNMGLPIADTLGEIWELYHKGSECFQLILDTPAIWNANRFTEINIYKVLKVKKIQWKL